jgi:hypothetical protein
MFVTEPEVHDKLAPQNLLRLDLFQSSGGDKLPLNKWCEPCLRMTAQSLQPVRSRRFLPPHAREAADQLTMAGFASNDISVLMPDVECSREFAHEKNTKASEGTTTEAATGGYSAALSVYWQEPGLSPFRVSVRLALPVRSWVHWRLGVGGALGALGQHGHTRGSEAR